VPLLRRDSVGSREILGFRNLCLIVTKYDDVEKPEAEEHILTPRELHEPRMYGAQK
jgi:hypothetical protein